MRNQYDRKLIPAQVKFMGSAYNKLDTNNGKIYMQSGQSMLLWRGMLNVPMPLGLIRWKYVEDR